MLNIRVPEAEQPLVEFSRQAVFVWLDQVSDGIKVLLQLEGSLHTEEERQDTAFGLSSLLVQVESEVS